MLARSDSSTPANLPPEGDILALTVDTLVNLPVIPGGVPWRVVYSAAINTQGSMR